MMKKKSKETLAEKISGILSTTPASFDPEDDADNQTSAKLLNESFDEEDDNEEELLSKFRRQNVDLLADVDERYAGARGSRKSLQEDSDDDSEEQSDEEQSLEKATETSEESSENEEDEEDSENEESDIDLEEANFSHFKDTDVTEQVKKGQCVRNQMNMWENLLEMRIQVQKCLVASNKMPQSETYKQIKKESGAVFTDKVAETKVNLCGVLDKLLQFQKLLLKKYPETKNLDETKKTDDVDDEEIPSDTDEELDNDNEESEEERPQKRRKLNDYENEISQVHNKYKNYRNSVIEKWNEKTRIIMAKNNSQNHSVLNQIEHNLSDKIRLIKRTQLKRSDYKIIGQEDLIVDNKASEDNIEIKPIEEYNSNIYDDDDFYHQLLRELIEVKSADITDPVQLGRQWIQLQNLRSKMKRKIDTKATKGRKIRYAVHTKLVNFMAPIDENLWTDEAKTELYNSLFGKKM